MIDLAKDIHSLSHFKRKTADLVDQMQSSGRPMILTVNGQAKLVVQDAASYQRLIESLDQAEAVAGIRRGLEDIKRGRTQPARTALEQIRRKYRIPRGSKA